MTYKSIAFLVLTTILFPILLSLLPAKTPAPQPPTSNMPPTPPPAQTTAIIIGSGLAGLSAATTLITHYKIPVHLLDRASKPGGNSIKASSGINGAPTKYQVLPDSVNSFYEDTVRSAGKVFSASDNTERRQKLVETLTKESASAVEWLVEEQGIELGHVAQLGGHSVPRTHRGKGKAPPPGFAIVSSLLKKLKESPLFTLESGSVVTRILRQQQEEGEKEEGEVERKITGVECTPLDGTTKTLYGPVIVAAGGFGGDSQGLLAQYRPDLRGYPSTNDPRPGAQPLLTSIGAKLVDMELVQVHPTGFVDPKDPGNLVKFLAAEVLRGEGGILLREGKRFVNEMERRKVVTDAITAGAEEEGGGEGETSDNGIRQWSIDLVLDEGAFEAAKSHIEFYLFKGLMRRTTVSELGSEALQTITTYASIASKQTEDPLGRTTFGSWRLTDATPESVVYVGTVTPVVHFTMGGVEINEDAKVLDEEGKIINGVWAAGEITGGLHGENRLGGSSLLECVVFGRRAGEGVGRFLGA